MTELHTFCESLQGCLCVGCVGGGGGAEGKEWLVANLSIDWPLIVKSQCVVLAEKLLAIRSSRQLQMHEDATVRSLAM